MQVVSKPYGTLLRTSKCRRRIRIGASRKRVDEELSIAVDATKVAEVVLGSISNQRNIKRGRGLYEMGDSPLDQCKATQRATRHLRSFGGSRVEGASHGIPSFRSRVALAGCLNLDLERLRRRCFEL